MRSLLKSQKKYLKYNGQTSTILTIKSKHMLKTCENMPFQNNFRQKSRLLAKDYENGISMQNQIMVLIKFVKKFPPLM